MRQQLAFDIENALRPLARRRDPATSRDAAASVDGVGLAARVLEALEAGPATSHELARRLNLELVTVSPRMAPLERLGHVERAGREGNRTVWRLTKTPPGGTEIA